MLRSAGMILLVIWSVSLFGCMGKHRNPYILHSSNAYQVDESSPVKVKFISSEGQLLKFEIISLSDTRNIEKIRVVTLPSHGGLDSVDLGTFEPKGINGIYTISIAREKILSGGIVFYTEGYKLKHFLLSELGLEVESASGSKNRKVQRYEHKGQSDPRKFGCDNDPSCPGEQQPL